MTFGGPNHEMRGWSRHKLRYLQSYVQQYRRATRSALNTYYIDGFAGPGRLPDEETGLPVDGSPLIALGAQPPFSRCYLIELDPSVAQALRAAVSPFPHADVRVGDANEVVPRILDTIHPRSPTLVVLDPTGVIGQVRWSTIEAISRKRAEVFINFP